MVVDNWVSYIVPLKPVLDLFQEPVVLRFLFNDGCTLDFAAPQVVVVEPGHEAWVVGEETAVLIEFDFEKDTIQRFGLPEAHRHT